jgi:hypothetical protein
MSEIQLTGFEAQDIPVDGSDRSSDTINGTQASDVFSVGPGEDFVHASGGDDTIQQSGEGISGNAYHRPHRDVFHLGAGHDAVALQPGDKAYGGSGADYYELDFRDEYFEINFSNQGSGARRTATVIDDNSGSYDAVRITVSSAEEQAKYRLLQDPDGSGDVAVYYNDTKLNMNGIEHVEIHVENGSEQDIRSLNLRENSMESWPERAEDIHQAIRNGAGNFPR